MGTPRNIKWFLICKIQRVCTNDSNASGGLEIRENEKYSAVKVKNRQTTLALLNLQ